MNKECRFCGALKWKEEAAGMCCSGGKVALASIDEPVEPLKELFSHETDESRRFLKNIRKYNTCFHMTSFGADNIVSMPGFCPTFTIQGHTTQLDLCFLLPIRNQNFASLFHGREEAQVNRRSEYVQDFSFFSFGGHVCQSERSLRFIALNQTKLRAENYIHLQDAIRNDADLNPNNLGQMVILPSFVNSPRYLHEYTQDAFTYVRNYGRPDLFITMTCNPAWPEITTELMPGQNSTDRHDLTARVFKKKVQKLVALLTKGKIFGDVKCFNSIEWQKECEIPNPETDRKLYDTVTKNMIHGPCGALNSSSPCMKEGKCTKKYPRALLKDTQTNDKGYPLYRRRAPEDGGRTIIQKTRGHEVLLTIGYFNIRQQGNVNVDPRDEVQTFRAGRYVSSNEAAWRILGFCMRDTQQSLILRMETSFTRNPVDGWPGVKAGDTLGRIYTVHVSNFECYCLRMLLNVIQGPTNFLDLKQLTVKNLKLFDKRVKLGLLEDDNHWDATMEEAVLCRSPSQIRELFALLITTCGLSNPLQLWDKYKTALSEDILHRFERMNQVNDDLCLNEALTLIEDKIITISGKKLSDFGMPTPQRRGELSTDLIKELSYNTALLDAQVSETEPRLLPEQKEIYDKISQRVELGEGGLFFLDAPGGTGKTFCLICF
ncbi:hypothetical protein EVAR_87732_1 [Eumeta japonica]|uniref:Helitron helicase-like domain-containing protein n=1 Tax=Eumeta variegata TaxID=151549 RepID=A0A4C1ZM40_EUMVA|nr:hypothetical protein EVAR_87732_1 [Eumeta japonica]